MLEVFLSGVGTVLRFERDTWSMVKRLRQVTNEYPPSLLGTSPWSQGINPSLPGTGLAFWSRGLGQHSRTASPHDKQTQFTTLFTHTLTLSTEGIRLYEQNPQRIWKWILVLPSLRATVGSLHHRGEATMINGSFVVERKTKHLKPTHECTPRSQ